MSKRLPFVLDKYTDKILINLIDNKIKINKRMEDDIWFGNKSDFVRFCIKNTVQSMNPDVKKLLEGE